MTHDVPSLKSAQELAGHLSGGGAALLPTDTLPALAASPDHAAQIWTLKQRPQDKPLILMAAEAEKRQMAADRAKDVLKEAKALAKAGSYVQAHALLKQALQELPDIPENESLREKLKAFKSLKGYSQLSAEAKKLL